MEVTKDAGYTGTIDRADDASNLLTMIVDSTQVTSKTSRGEELKQSHRALPKNLIRPLLLQALKSEDFGDMLSRSPLYADARME